MNKALTLKCDNAKLLIWQAFQMLNMGKEKMKVVWKGELSFVEKYKSTYSKCLNDITIKDNITEYSLGNVE